MTPPTRIAAAVLAVAVAAGCAGGGDRDNETVRNPGPAAPTSAGTGTRTLTKSEIKLTIKVTEKECFGDAGCNVGYRVRAGWPARKLDGSYEITYRIAGPTDGATIGTLTVSPDGTYTGGDEFASVPRPATKLTATVTEVEKLPY